jgi:DNA-binding transcriptional regulator YiaG
MKNKYQSKILRAIHEDAKDMHEAGIISDERMRYYGLVQESKPTRKPVSSARTAPASRISAKGTGL